MCASFPCALVLALGCEWSWAISAQRIHLSAMRLHTSLFSGTRERFAMYSHSAACRIKTSEVTISRSPNVKPPLRRRGRNSLWVGSSPAWAASSPAGGIRMIDPVRGTSRGVVDHFANAEHIMRDPMFGFRHNEKNYGNNRKAWTVPQYSFGVQ